MTARRLASLCWLTTPLFLTMTGCAESTPEAADTGASRAAHAHLEAEKGGGPGDVRVVSHTDG